MKTKKVPFDLEKAKAGAKIVDGFDREVLLIGVIPGVNGSCRPCPVIGYVPQKNECRHYTQDGKFMSEPSKWDLFILEEVKELVVRWLFCYKTSGVNISVSRFFTEEESKIFSKEIGLKLTKLEWSRTEFEE